MERNRSFNIPNKKYYTGGVKGNGIALGLQNPNGYGGLVMYMYGTIALQNVRTIAGIEDYGKPISTSNTSTSVRTGTLGLSDDASKSGIIVEPDTQISMIIKF